MATSAAPIRDGGVVVVHFRHVGSAPILREGHQKFKVPADARFSTVTQLLRSKLGGALGADDPLVRASP